MPRLQVTRLCSRTEILEATASDDIPVSFHPATERMIRIFQQDPEIVPRTLLFFGPPGTGKSKTVADVASRSGLAVLTVRPSDLMSQWVGESEKRFRQFFRAAKAARPCMLFFDEADAIFCVRGGTSESEVMRRIKTEALLLLQAVVAECTGVTVAVATNMPWALDSAIARRLEHHVFVALPGDDLRQSIVEQTCRKLTRTQASVFASALDGCSCAEVVSACRRFNLENSLTGLGTQTTTEALLTSVGNAQHRASTPAEVDRFIQWSGATAHTE
jgi:SpoVK/Ycf46/Vps4 family AAA+-type ATPase